MDAVEGVDGKFRGERDRERISEEESCRRWRPGEDEERKSRKEK